MAITTTARAILTRSLRMIGVLAENEVPTAAQAQDALAILNVWIDAAQLQPYLALVTQRTVYNLVADQATYTIGPSALTPDFSTGTQPRPSSLSAVGLLLNSADPAVEIPLAALTEQAYQQLGIKDFENPQPINYYYEPTMPTGTVFLWPTPTTALNDLVIYTPLTTAQFADLSTEVTLPPGYARMFHYNLAVEIAEEFGRPVSPRMESVARDTVARVKAANLPMSDLEVDPALQPVTRPTYNIWSDEG